MLLTTGDVIFKIIIVSYLTSTNLGSSFQSVNTFDIYLEINVPPRTH